METKVCTCCKADKEIEAFNFKNKAKGVRSSYCAECGKKKTAADYAKNPSAYMERNKARKAESRALMVEIKAGLKCEVCGESHPATLDFHHRDPKQKEANIGHMVNRGFSKEAILAEIAKCKVVCANCHRKLHYEEG